LVMLSNLVCLMEGVSLEVSLRGSFGEAR
jgi:hypothetical protein